MNRSQEYLVSLLEKLPVDDLPSDAQRSTFGRIMERISGAENINAELRRLYRVKGFGEAALGMLWVVDQTERDPDRSEVNSDEEVFVFSRVRRALSTVDGIVKDSFLTEEERFQIPSPDLFAFAPAPTETDVPVSASRREEPEMNADLLGFGPTPSPQPAAPLPPSPKMGMTPQGRAADESAGDAPETVLGRLIERFFEALQGGSDDRGPLMQSLMNHCGTMESLEGIPDGLRQCASSLDEFLRFVDEQQLLEDVRVMNAISNFQDPYVQWLNAKLSDRSSLVEQASDVLKNAKAMLE